MRRHALSELRFDGRVAVVTGAGRGIGRAHALLLAVRGASVVVNDVDAGPAGDVVDEITAAGATAVAATDDVATPAGGRAVVDAAVERFGRVDALVANAGTMRWAAMPDVRDDDLAALLAVHLGGGFHTARAAWPHMIDAGYGRIVLTTSTGVFGHPANTAYASAKGAVIGLARSLATAGAEHGIKVNLLAPAATTRLAGEGGPDLPPEHVAPMAAFLAHESCPVTGEAYTAGAGRFARLFLASTRGYVHDGDAPTVEDVAAHLDEIGDEAGYTVPASLLDWSAGFLDHLSPG